MKQSRIITAFLQTLLPSSPQNYIVDKITASQEGSYIALSGSRGVAILELPRRYGPNGTFSEGRDKIICRCVKRAPPVIRFVNIVPQSIFQNSQFGWPIFYKQHPAPSVASAMASSIAERLALISFVVEQFHTVGCVTLWHSGIQTKFRISYSTGCTTRKY